MHRTIIALITALFLVSAASASFAVYIDDDGPSSDVILATDLVLRASTYTDEIPRSGYTALFSEYEEPADMMLVISNGDVWIVETSSSPRLRTAIVRAVSELDVESEYTTKVPDVLADWEPNEVQNENANETDDPEDASEENGTAVTDALNDTLLDDDRTEPVDDDGSDDAENDSDDGSEREQRGFWARIAHALFGWMRR